MNPIRYLVLLLLAVSIIPGCGGEQKRSAIIVGIPYEPESLNPLYAFSGYEIGITEILYPSLVTLDWNSSKGSLDASLLLAEKAEWSDDSLTVKVFLREDLYWSDGKKVTSSDVIFSFGLYSDPAVQSRLYGSFRNYKRDDKMTVLPESFGKIDDKVFNIFFDMNSAASLLDLDIPVLPEHIYSRLDREKLIYSEKDIKPVTCGLFTLREWRKNQSIVLVKNESSFLLKENTPDEIIFKVIPDYNARLTQLKNREIDLADDIRMDDIKELSERDYLNVGHVKGREYDYIGWNNNNELFSSPEIRKGLTLAVNRYEILNTYLQNNGEIASSPVSPIFREAINTDIKPYPYDPSAARDIFKKNGWTDKDNDGILERGNKKFSFTMNIPSGNPRRNFAAVVIRNNLKLVGIDVKIEPLEPSVFFEMMFKRELNAWIAGWSIPIPPDLKPYWYSDTEVASFNVVSFNDKSADDLLDRIEKEKDQYRKNLLISEIQKTFSEQNPVTFLYWIDNIVAYSTKIKNIEITPLGAVNKLWEWETDE
jgi:peptide/nickel transport system substrate-binding protein